MSWDWTYRGVNISIPSSGGPECAAYLTLRRRFWETIWGVSLSLFLIWLGKRSLSPLREVNTKQFRDRFGRNALLVAMCLVLGCEIGFKLQANTVIYLLNPCHVTTAIQIYLLAGKPSKTLSSVFRIHLNFLNGPLLATLFPETLSRRYFSELFVYWVQHALMVIAPFYMLRLGGVYNVEPLLDLSWNMLSYGLLALYHFTLLQGLGLPTEINLNKMLCPASKDPFAGPNYRIWGTLHQMILCPLLCKIFTAIADIFLTRWDRTRVKCRLDEEVVHFPRGDKSIPIERTESIYASRRYKNE